MSSGWGATSDYMLLSDGDVIDVAMFTDWGFYHTGYFASFEEDCYEVEEGGSRLTVKTRQWRTTAETENFVDEKFIETFIDLFENDKNNKFCWTN